MKQLTVWDYNLKGKLLKSSVSVTITLLLYPSKSEESARCRNETVTSTDTVVCCSKSLRRC